MALLALCFMLVGLLTGSLIIQKRRFDRQRNTIRYRIHINGIRGKSTVTRYIAAILRNADIRTYGKTTGTAARVILPDGSDARIQRRGQANINEQVTMLRSFAARHAQAVVMECMAINPDYQDWLESQVMRSHIVVITNVRLDHQEEMGRGLPDIARSLARSIPHKAIVVTAEHRPELLTILREVCKQRGSRLLEANSQRVSQQDLERFGHVAHRDNVAIGLTVGRLFGIKPQQALASMAGAPADPGAFKIEHFERKGKHVAWANLFAVNDKESFAGIAEDLARTYPEHQRVILLNNRHDRPSRVEMFSQLAVDSLHADTVIALGDYEERVEHAITNHPAGSKTQVLRMGHTSRFADSRGQALLDAILRLATTERVLIVGTVNIHTKQSEQLLAYFDTLLGSPSHNQNLVTYQPKVKIRRGLHGILNHLDKNQPPVRPAEALQVPQHDPRPA